jgi:hypothetical protein
MVNGGHQKDVIKWWRSFSAEGSILCYSESFPHSTEKREKQIWVIREKKIKAKGKKGKRPGLIQRKNEN